MPQIYRILGNRPHLKSHVNYLKNGSPSLIQNSKNFFLLFQELRRTRRWPDPEKSSWQLRNYSAQTLLADFLMVNFISRFSLKKLEHFSHNTHTHQHIYVHTFTYTYNKNTKDTYEKTLIKNFSPKNYKVNLEMSKNCNTPQLYHLSSLIILAIIAIICLALLGKITIFLIHPNNITHNS